mgnify:CR=1 FL=1
MAQGILSAAKVDAFYLAVKNRDLKFLTKLPGIGKKTAERLLLELKDMTGPEGLEEEARPGDSTETCRRTTPPPWGRWPKAQLPGIHPGRDRPGAEETESDC